MMWYILISVFILVYILTILDEKYQKKRIDKVVNKYNTKIKEKNKIESPKRDIKFEITPE